MFRLSSTRICPNLGSTLYLGSIVCAFLVPDIQIQPTLRVFEGVTGLSPSSTCCGLVQKPQFIRFPDPIEEGKVIPDFIPCSLIRLTGRGRPLGFIQEAHLLTRSTAVAWLACQTPLAVQAWERGRRHRRTISHLSP